MALSETMSRIMAFSSEWGHCQARTVGAIKADFTVTQVTGRIFRPWFARYPTGTDARIAAPLALQATGSASAL